MESQNDIHNVTGQMNGATGGTGGVGHTANTGGPGLPGGPVNSNPITPNYTPQSFEELNAQVRNERINMFIGMTGGVGLPGDIKLNEHNEVISDISPEVEAALNHLTQTKIDTMELDECRDVIVDNNNQLNAAQNNINAYNANRAYTIGKTLHRAKYLTETSGYPGGFEKWCAQNLKGTKLQKTQRRKHMDMCTIYDVLDYASFGIEKLAALYPVLKVTPDLDPKHPIRDFLERFNVNIHDCPDVEDMRFEISIAIDMAKLENNGISGINKNLVREFRECGFQLNKKDFEAMKVAKDTGGDPSKYLEQVIENKKRITAKPPVMPFTSPAPKNIMEQAQEIRDTVQTLLNAPTISGDIQPDRIDDLIKDLEALKLRVTQAKGQSQPTQQTASTTEVAA